MKIVEKTVDLIFENATKIFMKYSDNGYAIYMTPDGFYIMPTVLGDRVFESLDLLYETEEVVLKELDCLYCRAYNI